MTTQTLTQDLERLRTRVEKQTVECTSGLEHDYGTCGAGCKDGYVPDPAWAGVLNVLRQECPHRNSAWRDTTGFQAFCSDCGVEWAPALGNFSAPTSYILRPMWQELADAGMPWAVESVLFAVAQESGLFTWAARGTVQALTEMLHDKN